MTKYLSILFAGAALSTVSVTSHAQQASWFEAEHAVYYEAANCIPNSDIQFYSTRIGGTMLKQVTVNNEGRYITKADKAFKPAFMLNAKNKNNGGVSGNDMVSFYEEKEFALNDIDIKNLNGNTVLSWTGEANPVENISFEVLKSIDGVHYDVIKTITANAPGAILYSCNDNTAPGDAFYKVQVHNSQKGLRYTSAIVALDGGLVKVYPTIADKEVTIALNEITNATLYTVYNEAGQAVQSGSLDKIVTSISVSGLAAGNYFIQVQNQAKRSVSRITKL